jgi:multiple sugar transport system substrate-binding protein
MYTAISAIDAHRRGKRQEAKPESRKGEPPMPERSLRVALVAGPMYDSLYRSLPEFSRNNGAQVEIGYHGSHPQLNAHLDSLKDVLYDLVSTHTKYAPSQLSFLAPLDAIENELGTDQFYPSLLDMAKIGGRLYGLPRNIDIKLLHFRTDLVSHIPSNWNELGVAACSLSKGPDSHGFVFAGMESGLFGMFFELAEMGGARLFPESLMPRLNNAGGAWALGIIRELYRSGAVPEDITGWHYDEAFAYFRDGHAAMICDWPGFYGAYRDTAQSKVSRSFGLARMPSGPEGVHRAYSGSHTFALTQQGIRDPSAIELLRFLTSADQQIGEARRGSVPPRPAVLRTVESEADPFDAERWKLLDQVIAHDMLIPPRLSYYPEIEEILWRTVRSAMTGEIGIEAALESMEQRIAATHRRHRETQ